MTQEQALLEAVRGGSDNAFRQIVEDRRAELHAHCYRILGLDFTMPTTRSRRRCFAAWRGLREFGGRSSLRTWLYRIATNACLDAISRRPKRVLPVDYGPPDCPDPG